MLVSMPKPKTTICNRGITNEKKSVEGSRRTCSVSLKNTARKPRKTLDTNALHLALVLVGEFDEIVFDQRMNGLAKNGGTANARNLPGESQSARDFGSGDFDALGALRLHVGQFAQ